MSQSSSNNPKKRIRTRRIPTVSQMVFSTIVVCVVFYQLVFWKLKDCCEDAEEFEDDFLVDILSLSVPFENEGSGRLTRLNFSISSRWFFSTSGCFWALSWNPSNFGMLYTWTLSTIPSPSLCGF